MLTCYLLAVLLWIRLVLSRWARKALTTRSCCCASGQGCLWRIVVWVLSLVLCCLLLCAGSRILHLLVPSRNCIITIGALAWIRSRSRLVLLLTKLIVVAIVILCCFIRCSHCIHVYLLLLINHSSIDLAWIWIAMRLNWATPVIANRSSSIRCIKLQIGGWARHWALTRILVKLRSLSDVWHLRLCLYILQHRASRTLDVLLLLSIVAGEACVQHILKSLSSILDIWCRVDPLEFLHAIWSSRGTHGTISGSRICLFWIFVNRLAGHILGRLRLLLIILLYLSASSWRIRSSSLIIPRWVSHFRCFKHLCWKVLWLLLVHILLLMCSYVIAANVYCSIGPTNSMTSAARPGLWTCGALRPLLLVILLRVSPSLVRSCCYRAASSLVTSWPWVSSWVLKLILIYWTIWLTTLADCWCLFFHN